MIGLLRDPMSIQGNELLKERHKRLAVEGLVCRVKIVSRQTRASANGGRSPDVRDKTTYGQSSPSSTSDHALHVHIRSK